MKRNNFIYYINCSLAVIIAVICLSHITSAKEAPWPVAPPYVNPAGDEIPMFASFVFYDETPLTKARLKDIQDAGFNHFRNSMHESRLIETLDTMEGSDLKFMFYVWEALDSTKAKDIILKYKNNPNISSYFIKDEPNALQFKDLKILHDIYREADSTRMVYINLFPRVGPEWTKSPDYTRYVEDYVRTVNPAFISFDCYPVHEKNGEPYVHSMYYPTIGTIAEVAKKSKRPFWAYILLTQHNDYARQTKEFIRFQLFCSLAYGAQGFSYFTYTRPDFDWKKKEFHHAPIDDNGKKTKTWYDVKEINNEVKALTPIFLGAEVIDVAHTGITIPDKNKRLRDLPKPFRWLSTENEGMVVSHFRNGGKEYLMLVNKDILHKQTARFGIDRPLKCYMEKGKEKVIKGSSLSLNPGSYAIFEL